MALRIQHLGLGIGLDTAQSKEMIQRIVVAHFKRGKRRMNQRLNPIGEFVVERILAVFCRSVIHLEGTHE